MRIAELYFNARSLQVNSKMEDVAPQMKMLELKNIKHQQNDK